MRRYPHVQVAACRSMPRHKKFFQGTAHAWPALSALRCELRTCKTRRCRHAPRARALRKARARALRCAESFRGSHCQSWLGCGVVCVRGGQGRGWVRICPLIVCSDFFVREDGTASTIYVPFSKLLPSWRGRIMGEQGVPQDKLGEMRCAQAKG